MQQTELLIIGGGAAGLTAGLYGVRAGRRTVLIERMFAGGQITTTHRLENYPGFPQGIGGVEIGMAMMEQAERFGLEIQYDTVNSLELDGAVKTARCEGGDWQAKAVILCMGAEPRRLGVEREDELRGRGVSYCATCDGAFYQDKAVAVVGGGDTACEDALYLAALARKVYLIHRRDELRAAGILRQRVMENERIQVLWNTQVEALLGDGQLEGLALKGENKGELQADGLFIAVGTTPQAQLVQGALKLDAQGAIVTDERMRTELPGVYAAGDVRATPLRQVVTAAADGAVAATEAAKYLMERA